MAHFTAAVYTWIIDGETARHVPHEHITKHRGGQESHMDAARGSGHFMPLADLEALVK